MYVGISLQDWLRATEEFGSLEFVCLKKYGSWKNNDEKFEDFVNVYEKTWLNFIRSFRGVFCYFARWPYERVSRKTSHVFSVKT